jgi:hypothetical protein
MPRIITYSLKPYTDNSDEYYQTITAFADAWNEKLKHKTAYILTGVREYHQKKGVPDRSDEEKAFELLALGVFLHEYGMQAHCVPNWSNKFLTILVAARNRWPKTEALYKILTGWVDGLASFLPGDRRKESYDFQELISWLKANGETIKAERFTQWYEYFQNSSNLSVQDAERICLALADDFDRDSQQTLGKYTEMVEQFLMTTVPRHRWKYDASLVSKTRLEYHLGMLGNEILNRIYRQRFLSTERKVVIVPPCMSAPAIKCKASETYLGAKCNACTDSCRVNQITKLGEKHGFDVFIIPDDVKVFNTGKGMGKIGVVGISCALTNWNGGWETEKLDIPAQGILLDYVGCKFHWDKDGFPTDTNFNRIQTVLGISKKRPNID